MKLAIAKKRYEAVKAAHDAETVSIEAVHEASRGWMEAASDVASCNADHIAAISDHTSRMHDLYRKIHALYLAGAQGGEAEKDASAHFWFIEGKIWVLEERARECGLPPEGSAGEVNASWRRITNKRGLFRILQAPVKLDCDSSVQVTALLVARARDGAPREGVQFNLAVGEVAGKTSEKFASSVRRLRLRPREAHLASTSCVIRLPAGKHTIVVYALSTGPVDIEDGTVIVEPLRISNSPPHAEER